MKKLIYILILFTFMACDDSNSMDGGDVSTALTSIKDQDQFASAMEDSDPFKLNSVSWDDSNLLLNVSYSGGCAIHYFTIVWPEVITMIYPPDFSVYVVHDANGDTCEAYPTENLSIDLSTNPMGYDMELLHLMKLGVVNASNPEEIFYPNE